MFLGGVQALSQEFFEQLGFAGNLVTAVNDLDGSVFDVRLDLIIQPFADDYGVLPFPQTARV